MLLGKRVCHEVHAQYGTVVAVAFDEAAGLWQVLVVEETSKQLRTWGHKALHLAPKTRRRK